MPRSIRKGPFVDLHLVKKVEAAQKELATLENQFKSFVRLTGLIAAKEQEIASQSALATKPPTKGKKAKKKKGKK